MNRVAAIVLAAGESRRFGSPKQLLRLDGETLVRRAATTALASKCAAVFVVVGAHADAVVTALEGMTLTIVRNVHWRDGIGCSLRAGVDAVIAARPPYDAVLTLLVDQPAVTPELLNELVGAGDNAPAGLVACAYAETIGTPALFARRHFAALRALHGTQGGKGILTAHGDAVVRIPFAAGAIDLDTPQDYENLIRNRAAGAPNR